MEALEQRVLLSATFSDAEFAVVPLKPRDASAATPHWDTSVEFQSTVYFTDRNHDGSSALFSIDPETQQYMQVPEFPAVPDSVLNIAYATGERLILLRRDRLGSWVEPLSWAGPGTSPIQFIDNISALTGTVVGDHVYLAKRDGLGSEPWITDGSPEGTYRIADLNPGSASSGPTEFTALQDGRVVFRAQTPNGSTLYATDGSPGSVERFLPLESSVDVQQLFGCIGDYLYFNGSTEESGSELWRTDGSLDGTELVSDIVPGPASSNPRSGQLSGGRLYFAASVNSEVVLWSTDGVTVGQVEPIETSGLSGGEELPSRIVPTHLYPFENGLFFTVAVPDGLHREITHIGWSANGTVEGASAVISVEEFGVRQEGLLQDEAIAVKEHVFISAGDRRVLSFDLHGAEASIIEPGTGNAFFGDLDRAAIAGGRIYLPAQGNWTGTLPGVLVTRPRAILPDSVTVHEGGEITLEAAASIAFEPGFQAFEWDLSYDGTTFQVDASGEQVTLPAPEDGPGTLQVALRISDVWGQSSLAMTTVLIENAPPVIAGVKDTSTTPGSPITLTANITDPGINDTLTIEWDLGDGTIINGITQVTHTYAAGGEYFATLTVTDSDGAISRESFRVVIAPPVTISATGVTLNEADHLSVIATLQSPLAEDVRIPIFVSGTATIDDDVRLQGQTAPASRELFIPAGQTVGSVDLWNYPDSLDEDVETLIINFGVPSNASLTSDEPITIELLDDDPEPTVFVGSVPQVLDEQDLTLPVTIALREVSGRDVVVTLGTGGTAQDGFDFRLEDSVLVIPAGQLEATTRLHVFDDDLGEGAEQIRVEILGATNAVLSGAAELPASVTHIISASDAPTIQFASVLRNVSETEGSHQILVTLSNPADLPVQASVTLDGDAVLGEDFTIDPVSLDLVFAPGETQEPLLLQLLDDATVERDKLVMASLGNISGALAGSTLTHLTRIADDDSRSVSVHLTHGSVWEGADLAIVATLSQVSPVDVLIPVTFSSSLQLGEDFFADTHSIRIPAGQLQASRALALADDFRPERDATITVAVQTPANAGFRGSDRLVVLVKDNDPLASFQPFVSGVNTSLISVSESVGTAEIPVYLDKPVNHEVRIPVSTRTVDMGHAEFSLDSTTVVVEPGQTKGTVRINIVDDAKLEFAEHLSVRLGNASEVTYPSSTSARVIAVQVEDNDSPPTPFWSNNGRRTTAYLVREGDVSSITPELHLAYSAEIPIAVQVTASGRGRPESDIQLDAFSTYRYSSWSGFQATTTVVFQPGETSKVIPVGIIDDDAYEGTESFSLRAVIEGQLPQKLDVIIADNDSRTVPSSGSSSQGGGDDWIDDISNDIIPDELIATFPSFLAYDGYADGSTLLFDANFNQVQDFGFSAIPVDGAWETPRCGGWGYDAGMVLGTQGRDRSGGGRWNATATWERRRSGREC